jgi:hypothetical protein
MQPERRKLNFLQTLRAVLWAMFGVRKGQGWQDDVARLNPVYVILTGVLFGIVFVVSLVLLVQWIVSSMTG